MRARHSRLWNGIIVMAPKGSQRIVKKVVAENRKARFNYEIIDT